MSNDDVPIGRLVSIIVAVLALTLLISLAGLVILGVTHGDAGIEETLTHLIETVLGVFVGIAAGKLSSDGAG